MEKTKKVLVITGDGINCEAETAHAFQLADFQVDVNHLNDLMNSGVTQEELLQKYSVVALPGGFSFGDHLSSGNVLALKIKNGLGWDFNEYARQGGLVLGICNGFQALIRLGVFGKNVSITHNDSGEFINRWVKVDATTQKCVWLKGIDSLDLPIRHGEGRLVFNAKVKDSLHIGLRYQVNPNGTFDNVAGLCDETGRILGMMPHPEAFVRANAHPEWNFNSKELKLGLSIFKNAYQECL